MLDVNIESTFFYTWNAFRKLGKLFLSYCLLWHIIPVTFLHRTFQSKKKMSSFPSKFRKNAFELVPSHKSRYRLSGEF